MGRGNWYAINLALLFAAAELKMKPREATAPFIPGGGVAGASDSRTHRLVANTSSRAIKAPVPSKHKGGSPEMHPIDYLSTHKKPLSEIEKEMNEIKRQMEGSRMSCIRRAPNQEKEKLQQVFSYSTGSILPRELLPGSDLLDRELSHAAALRNGKLPKNRLTQLEGLYDAVLKEVESRKSYMSEMIAMGRPEKAAPVEREILERMTELRKIHKLIIKDKRSNNNDDN
ncbi:hypothetical protein F441_13733 [Phytophthora nicotianae CJ01A1]|uniref:Enkurin domain-containing protein n=6 Tax=Phytophthora nicotianae TaxID=4792 RepID=W2R618_PHYN3|nr:hypothetical protein PPTG_03733 [Phytophthora nicotianae INRA-310]ETI40923.1 hypothetical protein F443_13809 [Phytophthora nicotianae P1569]ETK81011.1 hypothetical protein L915_13459 [Phytophthora nicotianae]ETO69598.1 hypothetical protein F444_13860 [Phytophthora nicotianae P1976]ETP10697.1 hypothetical protein F441_13733 [Phytophthora nicotianae CJ01A1]ETL34436.1 hypothetical protein L916_13348 [Phytophthora nicotianae]